MNNKFLPGAVLFIIAFSLSNLASLSQVKAQGYFYTFYGAGAGNKTTTGSFDSGFGYARRLITILRAAATRPAV